MTQPFDRIIPRRGTGSIKWDRFPELDPFWVADMDFASPPCVLDALKKRVDHGIMGYAQPHDGLLDSLLSYMQTRHKVSVKEEEIIHLGGLVCALSLVARAIGSPGDAIMTCSPIYPPFLSVNEDAQMDCIAVPHIFVNQRWEFDWDAMESAVTPKTKIFLLSNPQNPLGRVFTREEVIQLAQFCKKHQLVLVSDEIHCDLILDETLTPHTCAAGLPEDLQELRDYDYIDDVVTGIDTLLENPDIFEEQPNIFENIFQYILENPTEESWSSANWTDVNDLERALYNLSEDDDDKYDFLKIIGYKAIVLLPEGSKYPKVRIVMNI